MFSSIPRLLVHRDEIDYIYFPDGRRNDNDEGPISPTDPTNQSTQDHQEDCVPEANNATCTSSSRAPSEPAAVPQSPHVNTIMDSAYDGLGLFVHMPETAMYVVNVAGQIQSSLGYLATDFPLTVLNYVSDVMSQDMASSVAREVSELPQRATQVAREVVRMPHRASSEWKELGLVLFMLVFLSLFIYGAIFFMPLAPVNAGLAENRNFLYGIQTFYQILVLIPWVETCNFAMPLANIAVSARVQTIIVCVIAMKIVDAMIAEAWFGAMKEVFPIPFSIIVSGSVGFLLVVPSLYCLTPNRKEVPFYDLFQVLCSNWLALMVVGSWSIGIRRLSGNPVEQAIVGLLYGPLRFCCKILISSPLTTKLSPRRWILLSQVIDIIFTRVQVATFPNIDGGMNLLLLFLTELLTLGWRYYLGVDRLGLWWSAIRLSRFCLQNGEEKNGKITGASIVHDEFGSSFRSITIGCFVSTIPHISQLHLKMHTLNVQRLNDSASKGNHDAENPVEFSTLTFDANSSEHESDASSVVLSHQDEERNGKFVDIDLGDNDEEQTTPQTTSRSDSTSEEEMWEQRHSYHVVDACGANAISIIARLNQLLALIFVHKLNSSQDLPPYLHMTKEQWDKSQIYGWTFVVLMLLLLALMSTFSFSRLDNKKGREISLSRIMTYLYRDHFWFFFNWLVGTGAYVSATMIPHFGADFTFEFRWLSCPTEMDWPSCVS